MPIIDSSESYSLLTPGVIIIEELGATNSIVISNVRVPSVIGMAEWGPTDEIVAISSVADLIDTYGDRSGGNLVKFVETMLNEGAGSVKCLRVAGAGTPVKATRQLAAGAATTWDFNAKYYGTEGNDITTQVVAGSLTGKVTVQIIRNGVMQKIENVTNDNAAADYIGTMWSCDWVDFVKTGVATTNPSADGAPVSLASGANGTTTADGDVVTKMADWEADLTIDLVGVAFTASAALRTGMLNHCNKMRNRIYFMAPVDPTSKTTIIAEMAGYNDKRGCICYPPLSYYNLETEAYEDQAVAWVMGVVARTSPAQAAIGTRYGIVRSGSLSVAIGRTDADDYATAHVAIGMPSNSGGYFLAMQNLEYRDAFWGKIQVRTIFDKVEGTLEDTLRYMIGVGGDTAKTKRDLTMNLTHVLEYYKDLEYIWDYVINTDKNTDTTRALGHAYADVYLQVFPGLEFIIIHCGKKSEYDIVVSEVI